MKQTLDLPGGLRTPDAIQRFLDDLRYNKEKGGETARSPRRVLETREAHCFEGALLAAAALRRLGHPPLVVQMRAVRDDDHVLALFRRRPFEGCWGAVAKSNYSGLRFRSPVYRTLRELAMSYFDCYYNLEGEKSLRGLGRPVDLSRFDARGWETAEEDLWDVSAWVATRRFSPLVSGAPALRQGWMDLRLFDAGLVGSSGVPLPRGVRARLRRR
ncbi:MAG: hypothetical protein WCC53_03685 [Thermoanaerobaculia bacterium]|jgi:hypothetical protein